MIDVGNVSFACDECGICEQLEWRSRVAQELGETLQFDHCSCAKVGDEFWAGGYCGDAFIKNPPNRDGGNRKTGRAYRRRMHRKNIQKSCLTSTLVRYTSETSLLLESQLRI